MDEKLIREQLVKLLTAGEAHVTAEAALANVSPQFRSVRPSANVHSIWEELEHLRIAQEDILRFTVDSSWKSPKWPDGYWPASNPQTVTDESWKASVDSFSADLEEITKLVRDPALDLTSRIAHGKGQTYLREVVLVADHNAYHLGQIVQTRKLLGDWKG